MDMIPAKDVESRIHMIRGQQVMLDLDLADMYGVATKEFNRAVRRNLARFPSDFMFQLSPGEARNLRCQFGTSSWGGRRYRPYAFTEHGVAMLSGILRSARAVRVNIGIMRTFVRLRRMVASNAELSLKLAELEQKYDGQFQVVFRAIQSLMAEPKAPRKARIGFHPR